VSLPFAIRMAWRETRGAARHFAVLLGCVALGVAALVSVGTFAANLDRTLTREARTLTGGDLELRSAQPLFLSIHHLLLHLPLQWDYRDCLISVLHVCELSDS